MKENNIIRISVCPRCGQAYRERPALSRLDNETLICPDCGTREALVIYTHNKTNGGHDYVERKQHQG